MKQPLLFLLLLLTCCFTAGAQNSQNFPQVQTVIKFDLETRLLEGTIPFDKPFKVKISNIDPSTISEIRLYSVYYEEGKRKLTFPFKASTNLGFYKIASEKNTVLVDVPALKANKDFDILILRPLSVKNLNSAIKINNLLNTRLRNATNQTIEADAEANHQFNAFLKAIEDSKIAAQSRLMSPINNLLSYKALIYDKTVPFYNAIMATPPAALYTTGNYLTPTEINQIVNGIDPESPIYNKLYLLQKMHNEAGIFSSISMGLQPINYKYPLTGSAIDPYDFAERIAQLDLANNYVDSLHNEVTLLEAKDPANFSIPRAKVMAMLQQIVSNRAFIKTQVKSIEDLITTNFPDESIWLAGTNSFTDIKTTGASLFAIDAGIMNIWARNNYNEVVQIPKLYFGLNIFLKPIDKNNPSKYLQYATPTENETHLLETRPSIWNTLCITAGFTLGDMQNKDFDNVTSGFSFTLGPSIKFLKVFRLSAGAALLRRNTVNPLQSDKKLAVGYYAGLLVDYDLLEPIKSFNILII